MDGLQLHFIIQKVLKCSCSFLKLLANYFDGGSGLVQYINYLSFKGASLFCNAKIKYKAYLKKQMDCPVSYSQTGIAIGHFLKAETVCP